MVTKQITRALLVATALLSAAAAAHAQPTTVVLVRHAEKLDDSRDPPLGAAGEQRAAALAAALADAGVTHIFVTQYQRTHATAALLAAAAHIEPVVIATSPAGPAVHAQQIAAEVRRVSGGTVLVVGHSNTVPAIIAALGGPDVGEIGDDDYDDFFVLQIEGDAVRLIRARY